MANAALAQLVTWVLPRKMARAPNVKYGTPDAARRRARALAQLQHMGVFDTVQAAEALDLTQNAASRALRDWQQSGIVEQVTAGSGGRCGTWRVVK